MKYIALLKNKNFFFFWIGQFLSSMGDYLHALAIMWLMLEFTGSPTHMALVVLSQVIPKLIFGLLGGGYADRFDRRKVMIVSDLIRGTVVLAIPILYVTHLIDVWHFYMVAFVLGSVSCFFDPAHRSLMPYVVKDEDLGAANSLEDASNRINRIFIPFLIGILALLMPTYMYFVVDSATFFISAATLFAMKVSAKAEKVEHQNIWKDIGVTIKETAKVPRIFLPIMAGVLGLAAWNGAYQVGIPILAKEQLDSTISTYSIIIGFYGVGNVLSSAFYYKLPIQDKANWVMYGWILTGSGFLVMAFSSNLVTAIIGALLTATGGPISSLSRTLLFQREIPRHQMGKVFSLGGTLTSISISLSLVFTGPIFEWLSVKWAFLAFGTFIVLVGFLGRVILSSSGSKRTSDHPVQLNR
ncbi:MAG: MFS transporter [Bacillaceae bacterium]|nr:MFS transporter [Bacillaceae bacterium]